MKQTRRRTWLQPINVILIVVLVQDLLAIPIFLNNSRGNVVVGLGIIGDFFGGDPYVHRPHQEFGLGDVSLRVDRPTIVQSLLWATGAGLATILAAIPMIIYARRIVTGAMAYDPFTPEMARRLRRLGAIVLIGG